MKKLITLIIGILIIAACMPSGSKIVKEETVVKYTGEIVKVEYVKARSILDDDTRVITTSDGRVFSCKARRGTSSIKIGDSVGTSCKLYTKKDGSSDRYCDFKISSMSALYSDLYCN